MCSKRCLRLFVQDYLKLQLQRTEEKVDWLYSLEDLPFTLNTHYLADYNAKFFAYYKDARQRASSGDVILKLQGLPNGVRNAAAQYATTANITNAISALTAIGIEGIKANDLAKLLPPDQMEPALSIMAEVRAYFQGMHVYHLASFRILTENQWLTNDSRISSLSPLTTISSGVSIGICWKRCRID